LYVFWFSLDEIAFHVFLLWPEKVREDERAVMLQKIVSRNVGNCGTYIKIIVRNFAYSEQVLK